MRLQAVGMTKAELARRLHMSPANVYKIFKRSSVDAKLLRELSNILDYDFFRHFEPEITYRRQEPVPYNMEDAKVLLRRYIADLQWRVQNLEQRWETLQSMAKVE